MDTPDPPNPRQHLVDTMEEERSRPSPSSGRRRSPQLATLMANIRHYAEAAEVDPDVLDRGFALVCYQQRESNPIVALGKHFEKLTERAYDTAKKGKDPR